MLKDKDWLIADGATGTNYFANGLQAGDAPELWNIDYPDRVASLHHDFIASGADIILTNSFGGSSSRLKLHGSEDRVVELNQAAAGIARREADSVDRPIIVAGSIGPTGDLIEPLGELSTEDAVNIFAQQANALAEAGVDVIWLETMSSSEELIAAGVGSSKTGLPVVATMTFDTKGRTMMGLSPEQLIDIYRANMSDTIAYGANCGVGASDLVGTMLAMRAYSTDDEILVAKSNCGIPQFVDGEIIYDGTPELMAEYACLVRDIGVRIIGGCCGTTPEHIRAMRSTLESRPAEPPPDVEKLVRLLGPLSEGAEKFYNANNQISDGNGKRVNESRRRRRN
ncbi:MAG: methionine synthase I [Acidiferrobacteraceae bacterium]|nr:methionine synthase I [Acidiferrobacteraceae bacterium]